MLRRLATALLGSERVLRIERLRRGEPRGQTPHGLEVERAAAFRFFGEAPNPNFSRGEVRRKVDAVRYWYHQIDFGYGIVAPGGETHTLESLGRTRLLETPLRGKSVIDIGAWDGFYAFVCERLGAARVFAADRWVWEHPSIGIEGFLTARELLGSKVEHAKLDVFELTRDAVGTFDVVLFFGVLYHLQDPFGALRRLREITRESILVETHIVSHLEERSIPVMRFYEGDELNRDATNWWGPNVTCLVQMMRAAGFPRVEPVTVRYWGRTDGRAVVRGYTA